jgi:hypothetical protein
VPTAELGRLMAGGADGGHALALGPLPDMDGPDMDSRPAADGATATGAQEATAAQEDS